MRKLFITIFSLFVFADLLAQTAATTPADLKGFVYDYESGEQAIYINVVIKGTTIGCQSDANGYFAFKRLAVGEYNLIAFAIGYDTAIVKASVTEYGANSAKIFIKKKSRMLKDLKISSKKLEKLTEVKIGETQVTAAQIKQLPSIGGESDLAQYLQVVPGVVSSGDQGGQLYIRGGSPIQNKILLDGMTIYNPFHSIGLFSVFETDIMKTADVKTAGFNAEYGGATSAVIDVSTRDGNRKRISGKISTNTFASKVLLEGPLKKMTENSAGSSSFIITAKSSYLDKSAPLFYKYADTSGKGLQYNFTDIYAKLSFNSDGGSKLNLFGFNFKDNANFQGKLQYGWNAFGIGANFVITPAGSSTLISGQVSGSKYSIGLTESDGLPRTSSIGGFTMKMNFAYILENNSNFNYGVELNNYKTTFNFFNAQQIKYGDGFDQSTTELAAYTKLKLVTGKFVFEPGIRLPYYANLNTPAFEPRLGMKFNATKDIRLKIAAGRYSQNLLSTKSDRDIVNLFTGFMSGPEETVRNTEGVELVSKLQKSWHSVLGIEYDVVKNVELTFETYYKDFTQLINLNRDKQFNSDPNFLTETGNAYGFDFLAKYDYKRLYVWVTYSLAYTNRYDGTKNADGSKYYYQPSFDRRHNLNILTTYTFGKHLNWETSLRYNFGTGFPFTLTQGYYENYNFTNGVTANYVNNQGSLGIDYDTKLNGGRLPNYHRVDFAIKRKFFVGNRGVLEANFSITNVLNYANIFYFDRVSAQRINQLPLLPAAGVNYSF